MRPTEYAADPDDSIIFKINRERGILSPQDRAFLLEDDRSDVDRSDDSAQTPSERNTRLRIRKRITNALLDFGLIYLYLPDEDRKWILSNHNRPDDDELAVWVGAIDTMAFLYERMSHEDAYRNFEYSLQSAILQVIDRPSAVRLPDIDVLENVKVDIDTSRVAELGEVGWKINQKGWLFLDDDDLEAVEVLVDSKPDDEVHPELKAHLRSKVEEMRKMDEEEKQARRGHNEAVDDFVDSLFSGEGDEE